MAALTVVTPDESGVVAASMAATAVGGDTAACPNDGSSYVFYFRNDHSSAITIAMASQVTNQVVSGIGKVSKSNASQSCAANGGYCIFTLRPKELSGYLDGSGNVNFSYTSGNVALKVTAIKVPPSV